MPWRAFQDVPNGAGLFMVVQGGIMVLYFAMGAWQLSLGWQNPLHVGWVSGGVVLMAGMMACAWLVWQRRGMQRMTITPMLVVVQLAGVIEGVLQRMAHIEGARWPTGCFTLAALFLMLMVWEEISFRKEAAKDSGRETKLFDEGGAL